MLKPTLTVQQHPREPQRLKLTDTTPDYHAVTAPGGYGAPHTTRQQVAYVVLRLLTERGEWYTTAPLTYQPTAPLELRASDFTPYNLSSPPADAASLYKPSATQLSDGVYELTYEVYSGVGIPTTVYHYNLTVPLAEGQQVWLRRDGAWIDGTGGGALSFRREWSWTLLESTLYYDLYEIRQPLPEGGYRTVVTGEVQRITAQAGPLETRALPERVGAATLRLLLTGQTRLAIARLAKLPLPDLYQTNLPCEPLTMLALARAQLDALLLDGAVEGAAGRLKEIERTVNYVKERLQ